MKLSYQLFTLIILLAFTACEEEKVVIPDFVPPESNRVILIEEMTGASCPNCPKGTAELENLMAQYGDLIVPVAVHGNFLANPTAESKYDLRTEDSNALEAMLGPHFGKPCAAFNRTDYGGNYLTINNVEEWSSYIDQELEKEHILSIDVLNEYDADSRELKTKVIFIPKVDLGSNNRITVMILENGIHDAQESPQEIIEDFEFEHVLREILTEVGGDIISTSLEKNEIYSYDYTFIIPEDENLWVPENLEVVAFCNRQEGESFEVLQAAKAKMIN